MAKLTIKDEHGVERTHDLKDGVVTVGRAAENSVHVTDQKFSRKHFQIEREGEFFRVRDLGSTNGTRVNGKKVTSEILRAGDVIKVGETTFCYDGPCPPPPIPAAKDALPDASDKKMASADPAKYVVVMVEGPDPGKKYELGHAPFTIGRHPSNVLQLTDEAASSYHAEIKKEPIGYICSDLGSTNGTRVKAKGQDGFEKIVKSPLSHGMQIRIGKTVFEFRNVGGPSADDQLLGTVPLDPDKLHDKIAARPPRPSLLPRVMVGVLALVVFVGVIFVVLKVVPPPEPKVDPTPVKPAFTGNLVKNPDFAAGVTDFGPPVDWRVEKGEPAVRVTVDKTEDAGSPSDVKPGALVIVKAGAKNPACRTIVMGIDKVPVDSGRTYRFSGWMKGDGDGLFGLRVTWFKGERKLDQHEIVLVSPQPEWKEREHDVRPPAWADRAEIGVFAEGREGRACFDNLSFKIKPDGKVEPLATVAFREVGVVFEAPNGSFSVAAQGQPVIAGMDLALANKSEQAVGSILSAIAPVVSADGTSFRGGLFDFTQQQPTNYKISAKPGTWGVDLSLAVDRGEGQTAKPRLQFYIVGPAAQGGLEVLKGKSEQVLQGMEKHDLTDIGAVLFNAGGSPQLYLKFSVPVEMETRREGERRLVQIAFPGTVDIEIAPENVGSRKAFAAKKAELDGHLAQRKWASVWQTADELERDFGQRFKEAGEAAVDARAKVEEAFKPVRTSVAALLKGLADMKNFDAVKDQLQKEAPPWAGTQYEKQFSDWLSLVTKSQEEFQASQGEAEAQKKLNRAQGLMAAAKPQYDAVIALCNQVVREWPKSKAATDAQVLRDKATAAKNEQDQIETITQRLKDKAKPFLIAGQESEAANAVESDSEYQKNRAKLKEIEALIQGWKSKSKGP